MKSAPYRAYLTANVPLVALIFLLPQYHTFLWGSMGLGASVAVIVGTVKNRPLYKLPWILIAMALGSFISGDITYDILTKYLHESNPFPSLADAFYLVTYPLLAAGLLGLVRARRKEPDIGALLDALIVALGAALLSWIYLIQPYVQSHEYELLCESRIHRLSLGRSSYLVHACSVARRRRKAQCRARVLECWRDRCAYCRLRLRLDPTPRKLEGRRTNRSRLGCVLRSMGRGRSAPFDAGVDRETVKPQSKPQHLDAPGTERGDSGGSAALGVARGRSTGKRKTRG